MNNRELNFAYKIRHALNDQLDVLSASTNERLASSRKLALTRKKKDSTLRLFVQQVSLASQVGNFFNEPISWIGRLGVATPLLLGVVLFCGLYQYEQQQRITETAEIDAAVLSDELPLSAYLDHGFNAYLAKRAE
jgi:hypothetical protein